MSEYKEFKLYSTKKGVLQHNILRLHSDQHSLKSFLPSVSLQRVPPETQDTIPVPSKPLRKRTKTFFIGRKQEHATTSDSDSESPLLKRKEKDPDQCPWLLQNSESSLQYIGAFMHKKSFHKKPTYTTMGIDEAEALMKKVGGGGGGGKRWIMKSQKYENEGEKVKKVKVEEGYDNDDGADFEEDVQDDDGLVDLGIDDENEAKEANYRCAGGKAAGKITFEDNQTEKRKQTDKKLKKALVKLEKSDVDDSDDENPYATTDSELDLPVKVEDTRKYADKSIEEIKDEHFQAIKSNSPLAVLEALKRGKKQGTNSPLHIGNAKSPLYTKGATSPLHASTSKIKSPFSKYVNAKSSYTSDMAREKSPLNSVQEKSPVYTLPSKVNSPAYTTSSTSKSSPFTSAKSPLSQPHSIPKIQLKLSSNSSPTSPAYGNDLKRKRQESQDTKKVKPYSPPSQYSPLNFSATPSSMTPSNTEHVLLTEQDLIGTLKQSGPVSVRDLVAILKEKFLIGPKNQELLRSFLKKVVVHRKDNVSGVSIVELKDEYK